MRSRNPTETQQTHEAVEASTHRIASSQRRAAAERSIKHAESDEKDEFGWDEVEAWRGMHAKCDGKPQRRRVSMAESPRAKGSKRHEKTGCDPRWIIMCGRKKSGEEQSKRVIRGEESEGRATQPREARQSAGSRSEPQSHCAHDPGVVVNRRRRFSKLVRAQESNAEERGKEDRW